MSYDSHSSPSGGGGGGGQRAERSEVEGVAPDSPQLADAAIKLRSAYIHIPFCARRCPYCDFAVVTPDDRTSPVVGYVEALVAEIGMADPWGPLDAVNLGGGTPSTLAADDLSRIVTAVDAAHGIREGAEVSIEVNPEDWSPAYAESVAGTRFNRVSLGVQSFDDAVLAALGRQHTARDAEEAVGVARDAGFNSINVDLIYGSTAESDASWRGTVERALALEPDHLSAYALTVEPGTQLSRDVLGGAPAPDGDTQADRHGHLSDAAAAAGLVRYEVSNWARRGHHCRYNLGTWGQGEYLGFGLGAHDHRDGVRARNHRRLDRYEETVEEGRRPRLGSEELDAYGRERERLMLGLRRVAGVSLGRAGAALIESPQGRRLVDAGVIDVVGDRLVVTEVMLTDEAVRAVLSVSLGDC